MPSEYESYGRTAIEAIASGTPVICTPTLGLTEALGDAGIYVERSIKKYQQELNRLDDPKEYEAARKKVLARSKEMNPTKELKALNKFLNKIHNHESKNS